jgi:hypothetical protein
VFGRARYLRLAGGFAAALTLLVLALAMGGPALAAKPCWRTVLDDWTKDSGLDKTYSIACYDAALENLPNDIADYTDAYDQIANARQDALQGDRVLSASPGGGGDDDPDGSSGGVVGDLLGVGSGDSGSIPLPLLILAVLAGLLMAAGAAGLLARKLQARRPGGPSPPE